MNLDAIGAFGEIVGAIAVIATLLYLAKQIQQSNRIAVSASEIDIRNSFNIYNSALYSSAETAELVSRGESESPEYNPVEYTRLSALMKQGLNIWLSIEIAYENGMAPEKTFNVIFDDIHIAAKNFPGVRPIWRQLLNEYPAMGETRVFTQLDKELKEYDA